MNKYVYKDAKIEVGLHTEGIHNATVLLNGPYVYVFHVV